MAYPVAPGAPQYSGTFIPEIWSGKIIKNYYDQTVLSQIANTDYEGEIRNKGDKVIMRTTPRITTRRYNKGQNLQVDRPESPVVELLIDYGRYWNTVIDDVDKVQSDINQMNLWSMEAAEQMKIDVDTDVLADIYADVHAANAGATAGAKTGSINLGTSGAPVALTKSNVIDKIVEIGQVLDEQSAPETGRYILIPPWMRTLIMTSDLKNASVTGDGQSTLRNGRLGEIDRFTLFSSNLLDTTVDGAVTATNMIFGHKSALTYASQLTNVETLRAESTFGTLMRGLMVSGWQVVKPEGIGHFYAYKG
jgi:hypothetical protein